MPQIIKTIEKLPKNNQYVLAFFPSLPWKVCDAENNDHKWVVVEFVRGISIKERENLDELDERKKTYFSEDEQDDNEKPYCWSPFGSDLFFGQEATLWCDLPKT